MVENYRFCTGTVKFHQKSTKHFQTSNISIFYGKLMLPRTVVTKNFQPEIEIVLFLHMHKEKLPKTT